MPSSKGSGDYLRKLIDLPRSIIKELKRLAWAADKSVKKYMEYLVIREADRHRNDHV
jgi:hypothetical protein